MLCIIYITYICLLFICGKYKNNYICKNHYIVIKILVSNGEEKQRPKISIHIHRFEFGGRGRDSLKITLVQFGLLKDAAQHGASIINIQFVRHKQNNNKKKSCVWGKCFTSATCYFIQKEKAINIFQYKFKLQYIMCGWFFSLSFLLLFLSSVCSWIDFIMDKINFCNRYDLFV